MTTSSSEQFPARSPIPLMVHSICLAPPSTALRLFATAIPRSLWQCTEKVTLSAPTTCLRRCAKVSLNSCGVVYPTVSGTLIVVAPASTAAWTTSVRNSSSVRDASSGENSTSSHSDLASRTPSTAVRMISSLAIRSLCSRWIALVARKTWIRGWAASLIADHALSMSSGLQRASPQTTVPRTSRAMALTDSQSPCDAAGKPASITSTPSSASARATRSFSSGVMLQPGDCSPSRKVVSNINTLSGSRSCIVSFLVPGLRRPVHGASVQRVTPAPAMASGRGACGQPARWGDSGPS